MKVNICDVCREKDNKAKYAFWGIKIKIAGEFHKLDLCNEHKDFLDSVEVEYENEKGELIEEFIEHEKEEVEESIRINKYLFYKTGEMVDSVEYTGNHKRAGEIEINLKGDVHLIKQNGR